MNLQYIEKANLQHPWEALKIAADSANIQIVVAPKGLKMKHAERVLESPIYISMNGTAALTVDGLKAIVAQVENALERLSDTKALRRQEIERRIQAAERGLVDANQLRIKQEKKLSAAQGELDALDHE